MKTLINWYTPPFFNFFHCLTYLFFYFVSLADRAIVLHLIIDIFFVVTDTDLSSLCNLAPEAPCCMVFTLRCQVRWRFDSNDIDFTSTLDLISHTFKDTERPID